MIADNVFVADVVCCEILGIDPFTVKHLKYYKKYESNFLIEEYKFSKDYKDFMVQNSN